MSRPLPIGKPGPGYAGKKGPKILRFNHRVVIGASGAVTSQDAGEDTGVVVTIVASKDGRYLVSVPGGRYKQFRGGTVSVVGPTDAAFGAVSVGLVAFWRNDLMSTAGTVEVQFANASTNFTDADVPNPTTFVLDFAVLT